ncbi:MAG: hypothetical protein ABIH34_07690 [Nanoarchaeota archaeon]
MKYILLTLVMVLLLATVVAAERNFKDDFKIERAQIINEYPGEDPELHMVVALDNDWKYTRSRITVMSYDFDMLRRFGRSDLSRHDEMRQEFAMELPDDYENDEMVVRIVASDGNGNRRVKHRFFYPEDLR